MATEEFVDATIATLKVIGMVPKNGKLCVRKGQLCLDAVQHIHAQGLRRWIHGDSRDITLVHARNSISSAIKISRLLMNSGPDNRPSNQTIASSETITLWTLHRLLAEMHQCESGLQNLTATYSGDSMMVANLGVLLDRLMAHEDELSRFLGSRIHSVLESDVVESVLESALDSAVSSAAQCCNETEKQLTSIHCDAPPPPHPHLTFQKYTPIQKNALHLPAKETQPTSS